MVGTEIVCPQFDQRNMTDGVRVTYVYVHTQAQAQAHNTEPTISRRANDTIVTACSLRFQHALVQLLQTTAR